MIESPGRPRATVSGAETFETAQISLPGNSQNTGPPAPSNRHEPASGGNSLFFGESNLLTFVAGPHLGGRPVNSGDIQKQRLFYPLSIEPQTQTGDNPPPAAGYVALNQERYLREEGALTFPNTESCLPAVRAYFTWFHPCFPILDRADMARRISVMDISPLLLQALLFIGTNYCDENIALSMGFKDRSTAKYLFYTRAKLLFEAGWEQDNITTLQALFLMSFWRGGGTTVWDTRHWLGVVITHAQSCGLHRS
jgi:hypothetical protein